MRLMAEEDEGKGNSRYLHVYIFAIKQPTPVAAAP